MRELIPLLTLRALRASSLRTFLTLLGVVLGVALVFAMNVVNGSVLVSFRNSVDQMAGKTELVVGESTGLDEELLQPIRDLPGVAVASPVIQESVRDVATGTQLAVLAVDTLTDGDVRDYEVRVGAVQIEDDLAFLNDPSGVLLAESYAQRRGLASGDSLLLETTQGKRAFTVRGLLKPSGPAKVFGGDLLVMDVYAAQIAFERGRRFDRVDVVPQPGTDTAALEQRIESAIARRAAITRPQQRSADAERILSGFRFGLSVASMVALLVGGFIVYNALAIAVAQRRREIGILRALGATRRQVIALFVTEGTLIGALGSALGVAFGFALARGTLAAAGSTISEMYLTVTPEGLAVSPRQLLTSLALGVGTSLLAALLPAVRASIVEPATAMRKRLEQADVGGLSTPATLVATAGLLALSAIVAWIAHSSGSFWLGSSVSVGIALMIAVSSPVLARTVGAAMSRLTERSSPTVRIGVLGFERHAARNAVAIAALGMALANTVNIGCFLESIRQNTIDWFKRSLKTDIVVFAGRKVRAKFEHPLPESLAGELTAMSGVEFVNPLRMVRQQYRGRPFYLFSYDLPRLSEYEELPVVAGDLQGALQEISAGTGIAASEAFASEFRVRLGDLLTLQTPNGPRDFRVALIYVDYSAELGILTTTRDVYTRVWRDRRVDSFGVYTAKSAAISALRARIADELGTRHQLMVLENADYRREVLAIFERSFGLTRAMEIVALVVALLGIVNTLLVSVIDRTVEIGILRALGAVRKQVRRIFLTEAMLIALASTLLGLLGGLLLSLYTVKELLRLQMGWRIAWQGSPLTLLETALAAQAIALLGAWLPMRSAAALNPAEALQYE